MNSWRRIAHGKIERLGCSNAALNAIDGTQTVSLRLGSRRGPPEAAVKFLGDWLESRPFFRAIQAIGHRVVHGRHHVEPARITPKLVRELHRLTPYDPDHLPCELALIAAFARRIPRCPQVACFDTVFHRDMPRVAKLLPIPHRYAAKGIERYGFHGLSYTYLMEELARLDPRAAQGRVVLAHLGSGASLAAVRGGRSLDTSMGFTPASGLMMGTRCGDLDPGLFSFLNRREHLTPAKFDRMIHHESGLLGVSGTSSDLRDLLARAATDSRAADAVALFCYQAKKWIGAFAAVLGGVDTLVFAGGIGENAPVIRARICADLGFLGVRLDLRRNATNAAVISRPRGSVTVRVIRTDEELMIVRATCRTLDLGARE
jgi:acetate kinase